jgi:putative hemolysin
MGNMAFKELIKQICTPSVLAERDQFQIKLADSGKEIEMAQRLRFEVFNLEQGKGLISAESEKLDRDEFDEYCLHLIVVEKKSGLIVGTYRMHPGVVASSGIGFYSSREYNIDGLDKIAEDTIEMGRSCVSPEYRNGAVVALLWAGIAEILKRSKLRYLLGCVSLETTEPAVGWALYEHFKERNNLSGVLMATPTEEFTLPQPDAGRVQELLNNRRNLLHMIPPLFKGYLRLGVGICGAPALDKEFGSIDFLVLLDHARLPEKYFRHFCS